MAISNPAISSVSASNFTDITIPYLTNRPPIGVVVEGGIENANKIYAYFDSANDFVELYLLDNSARRFYRI